MVVLMLVMTVGLLHRVRVLHKWIGGLTLHSPFAVIRSVLNLLKYFQEVALHFLVILRVLLL